MPLESYTEPELLRLASEGNEPAFEEIFNRYKDKLYTFIIRINSSPEFTEDIIQETFLKLWKDKESLRSIEHFSSYLYMMSRNQSINSLKRFAKEKMVLSELSIVRSSDYVNDPGSLLDYREALQELQRSLQKLSPQQKLVYTLSRELGLKHEEIAHRLNISSSTVKNHIVQALRSIRERMRLHASSIMRIYLLIFLLP